MLVSDDFYVLNILKTLGRCFGMNIDFVNNLDFYFNQTGLMQNYQTFMEIRGWHQKYPNNLNY